MSQDQDSLNVEDETWRRSHRGHSIQDHPQRTRAAQLTSQHAVARTRTADSDNPRIDSRRHVRGYQEIVKPRSVYLLASSCPVFPPSVGPWLGMVLCTYRRLRSLACQVSMNSLTSTLRTRRLAMAVSEPIYWWRYEVSLLTRDLPLHRTWTKVVWTRLPVRFDIHSIYALSEVPSNRSKHLAPLLQHTP